METGRNSPCPCGSGNKHKNCCGPKKGSGKRTQILVTAVLLIFGGLAVAGALFVPKNSATQSVQPDAAAPSAGVAPDPAAAQGTPGAPQPPGPAPAGKVWSVEHGHWHDAPGAAPSPGAAAPAAGAAQPGSPQPPGPVPPGKVWSVEHGHWHDAP